jgi:hypothetical protein
MDVAVTYKTKTIGLTSVNVYIHSLLLNEENAWRETKNFVRNDEVAIS